MAPPKNWAKFGQKKPKKREIFSKCFLQIKPAITPIINNYYSPKFQTAVFYKLSQPYNSNNKQLLLLKILLIKILKMFVPIFFEVLLLQPNGDEDKSDETA